MANVFLSCELQGSPQFQSCLIVHLVLLRVWSDPVPFNCGHSYVRTQCLSANRGLAWEHQSCWKEVDGTSHSQSPANIICPPPSRVEMQRKAGPTICFPFQLSLKTLNFLTVSWGSVDCNQNWLASPWRAWTVSVAEVQCNISAVARHRAGKQRRLLHPGLRVMNCLSSLVLTFPIKGGGFGPVALSLNWTLNLPTDRFNHYKHQNMFPSKDTTAGK